MFRESMKMLKKFIKGETIQDRLKDIQNYPEKHSHTFEELQDCCRNPDGTINVMLREAHRKAKAVPQQNPGGCDVTVGPCRCGAWH